MSKRVTIGGKCLCKFKVECNHPEILEKYLRLTGYDIEAGLNTECPKGDTYTVKVNGDVLSIAGRYGEYAFLEKFIGWRFVSKGVDMLTGGDVDLPADLCFEYTPAFEFRQLDWICAQDPDWMKKNMVNHTEVKWIGFVHTLAKLSGFGDQSDQPCLSDPAVYQNVLASVKKILNDNPDCRIISVSQNDNQNYCKCEKCSAVYEEEGSPAGLMLRFVNSIAAEIADEYPDVAIETLAYQYTRKPPRITKPLPNVIVRLCSIECCFSHNLSDESCEVNAAFKKDIRGWHEICGRLYIWDYVTDFPYYIPPFPNFNVLLPNMRFFAENSVKGMYPEGNYQSESGEFGELRAYMLAKSMWNPYMSKEEYSAFMNDFLCGYYGSGWESIRKFVDWTVAKSEVRHFNIWTKPFDIIPAEDYIADYDMIEGWWNDAESKADDGDKLERVKRSRLQWTYIKLMLKPDAADGKLFFDTVNSLDIRWNEWYKFKSEPDFSKTPAEWVF